ncbi:hypothetical protein KEM60_00626 [Austwickia sp. TVS 96-490-7B]|nr:hypothetical protein [Austwickia sp. TVS 96-490-7B]
MARKVFGSDLDHLCDDDRQLIHAATGEVIWQGQAPHERPLSAFAMQIAVDRRTGVLPAGQSITADYLQRTRRRLDDLGAPANPFTGMVMERALRHLAGSAVSP